MFRERDASRELWEEFERTEPLSDPEPAQEELEPRLESSKPQPTPAER
jgi:hypothetical protein